MGSIQSLPVAEPESAWLLQVDTIFARKSEWQYWQCAADGCSKFESYPSISFQGRTLYSNWK